MDEFLDSSIDDNYRTLPNLLDSLRSQQEKLRKQVSGFEVDEYDQKNEWDEISTETHSTISELSDIAIQCDEIQHKVFGNICLSDLDESIISKLQEFNDALWLQDYLLWIKAMNKKCKDASTFLKKSNIELPMALFSKTVDLLNNLSSTPCFHLKEFTQIVCNDIQTQLIDILSNQYSKFLKIVSWPFTNKIPIKNLQAWKRKESDFALCLQQLITLGEIHPASDTTVPELADSLILPLELLVAPLRKRFRYHFYGEKKTNAKDKPEWYFTQVSQWISNHSEFLESHIQPHLNNSPYFFLNVKAEFTRALIQELVRKVNHELNQKLHTINDDYLFSHLIDELLLFDKELCTQHSYPIVYPRCIAIAQEEKILCRWRNLEKQIAAEKLKAIMESPTAWELALSSLISWKNDGIKVPECAERFMLLLSSISERYKQIPTIFLRLQFLELQIDLLLEFSHDLSQAVNNCVSTRDYTAYLNASAYIALVLKQWGEETFFVELHYYHKFVNQNQHSYVMDTITQLKVLRKVDWDFANLEGSAFDKVIEVFDCLCNDVIQNMSSYTIENLRPAISTFKKNRWQSLPVIRDSQFLQVSSTAIDFLSQLQYVLLFFKINITEAMQEKFFDWFIKSLDNFLLSNLILPNNFSKGGSEQIYYDISQVVEPLVADCLKESYSCTAILKRFNMQYSLMEHLA